MYTYYLQESSLVLDIPYNIPPGALLGTSKFFWHGFVVNRSVLLFSKGLSKLNVFSNLLKFPKH